MPVPPEGSRSVREPSNRLAVDHSPNGGQTGWMRCLCALAGLHVKSGLVARAAPQSLGASQSPGATAVCSGKEVSTVVAAGWYAMTRKVFYGARATLDRCQCPPFLGTGEDALNDSSTQADS